MDRSPNTPAATEGQQAGSPPPSDRPSADDNGHAISGMTEATIRSTIAHLEALLPERTLTIRELFDAHQLSLPKAQWVVSMASTMKPFMARFGAVQVAKFTARDWADYQNDPATKERYCVTTRGIQLRRAKAMFGWAVATERIPFNPLDKVKHEKPKPPRETEISHDDEAAVLRRVDGLMRAFILAAIDGGMRRDEVRLLEWNDVDFDAGTVTLHAAKTKGKQRRVVRLTPRALEAIRKLPRYPGCPYLFASRHTRLPYAGSTIYRRWCEAIEAAKVKPAPGDESVRLHDLRAAFCSRLARLGAPVPAIQKLIGHRSIQTTQIYLRVNAKDVEDAYALLRESQRKAPQRAPRREGAQSVSASSKRKGVG